MDKFPKSNIPKKPPEKTPLGETPWRNPHPVEILHYRVLIWVRVWVRIMIWVRVWVTLGLGFELGLVLGFRGFTQEGFLKKRDFSAVRFIKYFAKYTFQEKMIAFENRDFALKLQFLAFKFTGFCLFCSFLVYLWIFEALFYYKMPKKPPCPHKFTYYPSHGHVPRQVAI